MRFPKELRLLFFLSLTLGLFGGELGESFRLADDVSNDLVQVSTTLDRKCAENASSDLISVKGIAVAEELILYAFIISSSKPAYFSASDLLRLFSIQLK